MIQNGLPEEDGIMFVGYKDHTNFYPDVLVKVPVTVSDRGMSRPSTRETKLVVDSLYVS